MMIDRRTPQPGVVHANGATDRPRSMVVLLHGLGRRPGSMRGLEHLLAAAGYGVWNDGYPSRSAAVEALAERHVGAAIAACRARAATRVHFVTHSLGGILLRHYLQGHAVPEVGRIVMLSPPNAGSEIAERLRHWALVRWAFGPAIAQLGTGPDSLPRHLGAAPGECGIITGSASLDPWFHAWLPGPHDGKVSVESARLDGMRDFVVVPHAHALIMRQPEVMAEVLHFLAHGRFAHGAPAR
jgi:triacylglycerol lipase